MSKIFHEPLSAVVTRRFWRHIDIRGEDDCWLWLGGLTEKGYGFCYPYGAKGGQYRAHRVAIFLDTGVDPGDHGGMHSCDNPPCCNPAHLSAGTQKENLADMRKKKRVGDCRNFGENHGRCVISDNRIAEMLLMRENRGCSERTLAARFGISASQVHRILTGQSRKFTTEEAPRRPLRLTVSPDMR